MQRRMLVNVVFFVLNLNRKSKRKYGNHIPSQSETEIKLCSIINNISDVTSQFYWHNQLALWSTSYNWDMWYLMVVIFVPCLPEISCVFNVPCRKEKSSYSRTKSRGWEIHSSWTSLLHSWMSYERRTPVWSTASTSWKQWVGYVLFL